MDRSIQLLIVLLTCNFLHVATSNSIQVPFSSSIKGVGDPCPGGESDCDTTPNSSCDSTTVPPSCQCLAGYKESIDKSQCLATNVLIGGVCAETMQCVGQGPPVTSTCTADGICACIQNFVQSSDNSRCLPYVNTLNRDQCEESRQCQRGQPGNDSICDDTSKVCRCNPDSVDAPEPNNNFCYKKATFVGDACEVDTQCTSSLGESECATDKTCQCSGTHAPSKDNTKCVLKVSLEQPCVDSSQCDHIQNADCLTDASNPGPASCKCKQGYRNPSGNLTKCYALAFVIGGTCPYDEVQCSEIPNAECASNSTCQCLKLAFPVVSGTRNKCLSEANLHSECEETVQCQTAESQCLPDFSNPTKRACECRNQFVEVNNECFRVVDEINVPCEHDAQCSASIDLSECRHGVCQCSLGYGYYRGHCYIPAKIGEPCDDHAQCTVGVGNWTMCTTTNSVDEKRRCQCQPGAIYFDKKCYARKVPGDPCHTNDECTVSTGGAVLCDAEAGMCKCYTGTSYDANNKTCSGLSGSGALNVHYFSFRVVFLAISLKYLLSKLI